MEHIIGQYGLFRIITITQRLIEHRLLKIELDFIAETGLRHIIMGLSKQY